MSGHRFTLLILLTSVFVCCQNKNDLSIKEVRTFFQGQGLEKVESVLYDAKNQALYITNGLDYSPGTDGFISKASVDGTDLNLKWVTGLNRPTGMALKGNALYVADLSVLLVINTETGEVVERYKEPIAGSALNDVAIDKNGDIYVSASTLGAVFKLVNGALKLWVQDEILLKYANGLLSHRESIIVAGLDLSGIDIQSRELVPLTLSPPIKDFEGLVGDGHNGFFITTIGQSSLYHVTHNMNASLLLEERDYFGDISFDQQSNTLFIPRGNSESGECYITALEFNK